MGGFAGLGGVGSGMGNNNDDFMNHMDLNFANSLGGLDLNLNMDDNDPLLRAIGGLTSTSNASCQHILSRYSDNTSCQHILPRHSINRPFSPNPCHPLIIPTLSLYF